MSKRNLVASLMMIILMMTDLRVKTFLILKKLDEGQATNNGILYNR